MKQSDWHCHAMPYIAPELPHAMATRHGHGEGREVWAVHDDMTRVRPVVSLDSTTPPCSSAVVLTPTLHNCTTPPCSTLLLPTPHYCSTPECRPVVPPVPSQQFPETRRVQGRHPPKGTNNIQTYILSILNFQIFQVAINSRTEIKFFAWL